MKKNYRQHEAYRLRDEILREIGFRSYKEYLASDLWAEIRAVALTRDGHKCHVCRRPATQVHHTKYTVEVMTGVSIISLKSICGGCHRGIEFSKRGKRTIKVANKTMRRRRKKIEKDRCWRESLEYRRLKVEKARLLAIRPRDAVREEINEVRRKMRHVLREHKGS